MKTLLAFGLALLALCINCQNQKTNQLVSQSSELIAGYDFSSPYKQLSLNYALDEVSGLAYDHKTTTLWTINDEQGVAYQLSVGDGSILDQIRFADRGDYEGITIVDSLLYVVESKGDIHTINLNNSSVEYPIIKTILSKKNDVEGLVYQNGTKELLLACKGRSGIKTNFKDKKSVFGYNTLKGNLNPIPHLSLLESEGYKKFAPSGIAIHPFTQQYFVISSRSKQLAVIDKLGKLENMVELDSRQFLQPEGICFDSQGNLYISNEKKGLKVANVLIFKYQSVN